MTAESDAFPEWEEVEGGFVCADDEQMQFALACELMCGFDLPRFDVWARSLPECGLKREMLERRALGHKSLASNNMDAAFRHLEWMLSRKREDTREQILLPLARHADSVRKKRAEVLIKARESRPQTHDWNAVAKLEVELLESGKSQRDLAGIIEKRLGVPKTTYREWRRSRKTTV